MREVANAHEGVEGGALDAELRRLCEGGRPTEAATLAIRRLGPELLRFLTHALRDETRAGDAFSLFAEDVWRGLPGFRWESSFRTWAYLVARRAAARQARGEKARGVNVPLSEAGPLSQLVAEVRTHTQSVMRNERRNALDQLRDELDVDERMLLALRIEREIPWPEIAHVLAEGEDVTVAAARLRKRFQLLKDRLKKRGRELGLVPSGSDG